MIDVQDVIQNADRHGMFDGHGDAATRMSLDADNAAQGLGQLALAIVNLLHELLERQAIRRMDSGTITDAQAERLGQCLMRQSEAIDELCESFGVAREDLDIDLGPLGKLV